MKKTTLIIAIITALVISGVVFFALKSQQNSGVVFTATPETPIPAEPQTASQPSPITAEAKKTEEAPLSQTYQSKKYQLSFKYPAGFVVTLIPSDPTDESSGDTIIIKNSAGTGSIQIVISPFDEPNTTITAERIRKDIPDIQINNPQEVTLGSSGKGIAFESGNGAGLKTREVWFAYKGHLFQITTYFELDTTLQKILSTWRFF